MVFLRTDLAGGDFPGTGRLLAAIHGQASALGPLRYAPDLHVAFAGELMHAQEEHRAVVREATLAGVIAFRLIFASIVVFFRKLRSFFLLVFSLSVPILVTFAFTQMVWMGSKETRPSLAWPLCSCYGGNGCCQSLIN